MMPTRPDLARLLRRLLAPLCLAAAATGAHAAPTLLLDGTTLIGAKGVNVNGTLYDVSFVDGSCVSLFGGCVQANFDFTDEATAVAASWALLDQVFLDGPQGAFDSNPTLTRGCTSVTIAACSVVTPYGPVIENSGFIEVASGVVNNANANFAAADRADLFSPRIDTDLPNETYARWTASPVPEPGTWALLALGLGLIGMTQRRRLRAGATPG